MNLNVALESTSPQALAALRDAGLGTPILPDDYDVVRRSGPYPVLTDARSQPMQTPVSLQWMKGRELSPAARQFVEFAKRFAVEDAAPATAKAAPARRKKARR